MQEGDLPVKVENAERPTSLSLTREERLRANLNRLQEKSFISTLAKISLLLFFLLIAYFTGIFALARASSIIGQAMLPPLLLLCAVIYVVRKKKSHEKQAPARIVSFAAAAATDVLKSNWDKIDYYSRLYVYASPELAAQIHNKRKLLNQVLDERKEALGDFVDIEQLELRIPRLQLLPSPVMELTGILRCTQATVPIVILVNVSKPELTLDGIKVIKKELVKEEFVKTIGEGSKDLLGSQKVLPLLASMASKDSPVQEPALQIAEVENSSEQFEAGASKGDEA
jgi:hypothetical protein